MRPFLSHRLALPPGLSRMLLTRELFQILVIKIGEPSWNIRHAFLRHCYIERDNIIFSNILAGAVRRDAGGDTSVKRRSSSPLWNPGTRSNYQALLLLPRWPLRDCAVIKHAKVCAGANIVNVRFYVITCTSRETD